MGVSGNNIQSGKESGDERWASAKVKARAIASLKIALEKAAALAKLAEAASDKNLY